MNRRELLVAGTIASVGYAEPAAAAAQSGSERGWDRVADLLTELRNDLRDERRFAEISPVRTAQQTFLRTNGKLPNYLELGVDVWFAVRDWHVRWQQPIVEGRDPEGRLTLAMMGTQLILRPDVAVTYIGTPYDNR
jgi:hypothetical protein